VGLQGARRQQKRADAREDPAVVAMRRQVEQLREAPATFVVDNRPGFGSSRPVTQSRRPPPSLIPPPVACTPAGVLA